MALVAPGRVRRAVEACALVLASLAFLAILEAALRAGGVGSEAGAAVDFGNLPHQDLYAPDPADAEMLVLAPWLSRMPERQSRKMVNPDRFPARRLRGELRIFAVGDSTVFGFPASGHIAFPLRLQELLQARMSEVPVRVVNAGVPGNDSGRVRDVLEEVLRYEPQAVIVYTGHNEYLRRFAVDQIALLGWRFRLRQKLVVLRTYQLLASVLAPVSSRRGPGLDVTNRIEEIPKLERATRPRTDAETELVMKRYRQNLHEMAEMGRQAGCAVVVCTVASQLQARPRWCIPRDDAEATLVYPMEGVLAAARPEEREGVARAAIGMAPGHATFHHALGECLEARGLEEEAREEYLLARELETNPRRGGKDVNDAVRALAGVPGVTVVDVERLFLSQDDRGCFSQQLFWDHCHPDPEGHARIARALADAVEWGRLAR